MMNTDAARHNAFEHLEDDWESASRYLSLFIDECQETLDELTQALLALEAGDGRDGIEQLFIGAHRIKGSAASIGLNRPAKLAHLMEDLLQVLVDEERSLEPKTADGLLACTDGLREYVEALRTGRPASDQFESLARQLLDAQHVENTVPPVVQTPEEDDDDVGPDALAPPPSTESAAPSRVAAPTRIAERLHEHVASLIRENEREHALIGRVTFEPDLPIVGLKARLICSKLSNVGDVRYLEPPPGDIENRDDIEFLEFGIITDSSSDALQGMLCVAGVQSTVVESLRAPAATSARPQAAAKASSVDQGPKPVETLRVDIDRLDRLMDLAGQLSINKARLTRLVDEMKRSVAMAESARILSRVGGELEKFAALPVDGAIGPAEIDAIRGTSRRLREQLQTVENEVQQCVAARSSVHDLFETIHLLDSISDGIRQSVMDMRMLPIGPLFNRFHRVVRDITRQNGKQVHLVISGEKTELDKRVIDELGDPMIHLIRNAADHGIESPEVRQAVGKPAQGTITLDAFHRGSSIVIRVSDDGIGLDVERLRSKAVEKGLIGAAEAQAMSPQQVYQLIWLPGLSTAEKVTDVSGRGVGMDIVRSKICELNGSIDVESEADRGTTFTIKLPLTLAVFPSLMIEIGGDVFALPLESVVEIVDVNRGDIRTVHGLPTVPVRDRVIAMLAIGSMFRWNGQTRPDNAADDGRTTLVIIGEGSRQLGLAVDRVIGEEDVVIKSIADNYRNIAGIAGATILGDGRISLILDPSTLLDMSCQSFADTTKP